MTDPEKQDHDSGWPGAIAWIAFLVFLAFICWLCTYAKDHTL